MKTICVICQAINAVEGLSELAAEHDRSVEARAEKRIWLKMAEYCRKERRDICGDRPERIIGDAYKTGRHDGMGALMSYCEAKSHLALLRRNDVSSKRAGYHENHYCRPRKDAAQRRASL